MHVIQSFLQLLFPGKCPVCGRVLPEKQYRQEGLCRECASDTLLHRTQTEGISGIGELYCPLAYIGPVRQALRRYKFEEEAWMAAPFARVLHTFLEEHCGYDGCTLISYPPVSPARLRQRGYDQAALLAYRLSALSGIPCQSLFERTDGALSVTSRMGRNARMNAKRFSLTDDVSLNAGTGVLLVDDIVTTGSTLSECATLLQYCGISFIKAVCVASGRQDVGGACA